MKHVHSIPGILLFTAISTTSVVAQPSDAQIIKDLSNPGVLEVKLVNKTTKKVWNSAHSQYMWERGATVWRNANVPEYPNARVKIIGFARYHYGASTSFREFKVAENEYEGIPTPSKDEMMVMLKKDMSKFLGSYKYNKIVGDLHYMRIQADDGPVWHNPRSFTMPVEVEYDMITSNTEVTTIAERLDTRFYRDAINSPWKEQFVTMEITKEYGEVKKYGEEEIRTMPTLGRMDSENKAQAALAGLPSVEIPTFSRDIDVFIHTHNMLRESSADEFEAYLMKMLAPSYFIEGSTTLLTQRGADLINNAVDRAFKGKSTYAEQYCPDPGVKHHQEGMIEFWNKTTDKKTRMTVGLYGGGWKNGQKTGQEYKITALEVWLWTDDDNIARLNSYEPGVLCK